MNWMMDASETALHALAAVEAGFSRASKTIQWDLAFCGHGSYGIVDWSPSPSW